jgi:hypothetical protein
MAQAFSVLPILWGLGSTLGPFIGGITSNPEKTWPDTFGKISLLRTHPYFLPCAISGFIAFVIFLLVLLGLKEVRLYF